MPKRPSSRKAKTGVYGAGPTSADSLEAAQQLIFDAWETGDHRRRMALAKQALELSPLCVDAYVLLARECDGNLDEMIALYRQGVAAAEEALGKASFRDLVGHFWGILETRPYMRARHGLAQALWNKGLRDEAVTHYLDMLRLNPGDNQGIRYVLIDYLLTLGRDDDAARLIRRYRDDGAAAWAWSSALLAFRRSGDSVKSGKALAEAMISNAHVAELLLGDKKMPRKLPAYIGMGDKNEAVAYVHGAAMAWAAAPDALAWLRRCRDGGATASR
jgi:tetratricopeptide (TPR) repeat protein